MAPHLVGAIRRTSLDSDPCVILDYRSCINLAHSNPNEVLVVEPTVGR